MKALTIRQPHASLVAVGAKTIETRSKPTSYRGPLLIHAGKAVGEPWSGGGFNYRDGTLWTQACDDTTLRVPLGAVVASCQLVDCVPIVESPCGTDTRAPDHVCVSGKDVLLHRPDPGGMRAVDTEVVFAGERPFGDFSPGRYAWLLGDVKPTTERCPRCWGKGSLLVPYTGPMAEALDGVWVCCTTCAGTKERPPVPMRGRQGLWTPNAKDWAVAA